MGLFKAGLVLAEKVAVLLNDADLYNQSLKGNISEFDSNIELRWIIDNTLLVSHGT
jgi:hypothetical protein